MDLYIIDAIGPFFKNYRKSVINWSKIPFSHLELDGQVDLNKFSQVQGDFAAFIDTVGDLGYNAISIDDVAHLVVYDFYQENLKRKLAEYQLQYLHLFKLAKNHQQIVMKDGFYPASSALAMQDMKSLGVAQ